ncbi:MAG: response regulator [Deltaproteobacteria bacterium]|nr:response regulator [Deltaproteobacteria bacterium]
MIGWALEECLGKKMDIFVPDDAWPETKMMINRVLAGESFSGIETRRYTREGDPIPVTISVSIYRNSNSNPVGSVHTLRDVREQKKLESQLQRAQKMEAIGTLAGGVAHDLNNILSGLVSYPELLLMDIPQDSPLRKPILTIQKSGERAAMIVQDLLTLARRGVAVTEVVNLNQVISEYLQSPEHKKLQSFHPQIQVETRTEADVLNILGSPVHLAKTVMNLVSNAAEAMPENGKIFISTENRYIDKPIRGYDEVKEGDYVCLTVSDTGVGILAGDLERIFEPFYTKKVMGRSGTGLGMSVVWGTVKDHKGYVDVQSSEGKGTTFILYFPVTREKSASNEALLSIENYMGNEKILIVDDVEEQRDIASGMLKKLGYSVTSVSSGEEAVEYMKDNSADMLVLDMIMDPGIDGLETYKRILESHPGQRAIIASGFSETERVKKAQRLGAGAYVKKPYLLEKIGMAVRIELDE